MKTIVRTKLLDDTHIELREYELFKFPIKVILCSSKDYKTCYHLREPYHIYSLVDQKKGKVINTQTSTFYPYKTYRMYKLLWKPKKEVESMQVSDKNPEFVVENGIYKAKL